MINKNKAYKYFLLIFIIFNTVLCVYSQKDQHINESYKYTFYTNQYNKKVLNTLPQKLISIKNKKDISRIVLTTYGCVNKLEGINFDNSTDLSDSYLKETGFIDYSSKEIITLSQKLNLDCQNSIQTAKTSLIYIKSNINYDQKLAQDISIGKSKGKCASETLKSGFGTCSEYTNLFIALMRLNKIPCKFVTGVYINGNTSNLHAWAEFYDSNYGWIPVDPQFGILGVTCFHIKLFEGFDFTDTQIDFSKIEFKILSKN